MTKSTSSTKRLRSWVVTTKTSRHAEMMSFAPPVPGSRTFGASGSPMTLVLTLPWRSIWAVPRKP